MIQWVLLAALHVGAAQLDVSLREQNRIGFVPLVTDSGGVQGATQGTSTTISAEITPALKLRLFRHGTDFIIAYQPQLLFTDSFGSTNTLLLHTGSLSLAQRLARTLSLSASASGTIGELDYFRARRLLNSDTGTVFTTPENAIIGYASGTGYVGLVKTLGRFGKLELGGTGLHNGPLPGERHYLFFKNQNQAGATARYTQQLDRTSSIALEGEARKVWFEHGPYYTAYTPAAIYRYIGPGRLTIEIRGGAMLSTTEWGDQQTPEWLIGQGLLQARTGSEHRVLPVFNVAVGGFEVHRPGLYLQSNATLNLLPFYDPVNGVLQQRIGFGWNNNVLFSRSWRGRVNLQVLVPAKWQYGKTSQPFIDQDMYAILNAAVIRRLTPLTYVEAGAYVTQRWEDYTQVTGHWYRPEIVLYLAFQGQATVW